MSNDDHNYCAVCGAKPEEAEQGLCPWESPGAYDEPEEPDEWEARACLARREFETPEEAQETADAFEKLGHLMRERGVTRPSDLGELPPR
jgi:hypothetical protein